MTTSSPSTPRNDSLDHLPEYFAKPGVVEGLAEAHPTLLIRQMANEILRLRTPSSETRAITCEHGTVGYCETCALRDPGEMGEQKPRLIASSAAGSIYSVEQLEEHQATFENLRREYHKRGDHEGQRSCEFALEAIRRYQMGVVSSARGRLDWHDELLLRWCEWTGGHLSDQNFLGIVHDIVADNLLIGKPIDSSDSDGVPNA